MEKWGVLDGLLINLWMNVHDIFRRSRISDNELSFRFWAQDPRSVFFSAFQSLRDNVY